MVVRQGAATGNDSHPRPQQPAGLQQINEREQQLLAAYRAVSKRMRELPVYNDHLDIRVVGLARIAGDVTVDLALATIGSINVLGALQASREVKAALKDRIT